MFAFRPRVMGPLPAGTLTLLLCWVGVVGAWQLVMKVPEGGDIRPAASVYDLWVSNMTLNEDHDNALHVQPGIPYKSRAILDWDSKNISLVSTCSVKQCSRYTLYPLPYLTSKHKQNVDTKIPNIIKGTHVDLDILAYLSQGLHEELQTAVPMRRFLQEVKTRIL